MIFQYPNIDHSKRANESNEDYKTKKKRDVILELTDIQNNNLTILAYKNGFKNPSDFLESLIGDLTKWHSNGSDEESLAFQWLSRAFGSHSDMFYFREYLAKFNMMDFKTISYIYEDKDEFDEQYTGYLEIDDFMQHEDKEECWNTVREVYMDNIESTNS